MIYSSSPPPGVVENGTALPPAVAAGNFLMIQVYYIHITIDNIRENKT